MHGARGIRRFGLILAFGPFFYLRRRPFGAVLLMVTVIFLTLLTQIGGLLLWLCLPLLDFIVRTMTGAHGYRIIVAGFFFLPAYIAATLFAVPLLAATAGRAPLACGIVDDGSYAPLTIWTCLLNRHYATPGAKQALERISSGFGGEYPDVGVYYLDAGFPFGGGFPMLPHLSHGDGRKIDFAFVYDAGRARARSPVGYWGYERPRPGEPAPCEGAQSWLRWDFEWLQPLWSAPELDSARTGALLRRFAADPAVDRVFLEPHLKQRMGLDHPGIRFQGCAAARHDDHFHVAFR